MASKARRELDAFTPDAVDARVRQVTGIAIAFRVKQRRVQSASHGKSVVDDALHRYNM